MGCKCRRARRMFEVNFWATLGETRVTSKRYKSRVHPNWWALTRPCPASAQTQGIKSLTRWPVIWRPQRMPISNWIRSISVGCIARDSLISILILHFEAVTGAHQDSIYLHQRLTSRLMPPKRVGLRLLIISRRLAEEGSKCSSRKPSLATSCSRKCTNKWTEEARIVPCCTPKKATLGFPS